MLFGILAHIKTYEFHAKLFSQYLGHFGLTHAGRSHKKETCYRLVICQKPCTGHANCIHDPAHSLFLSVDTAGYAFVQILKRIQLGLRCRLSGYITHLCQYCLYHILTHGLLLLTAYGMHAPVCSRLVYKVYRLIRQISSAYEFLTQMHRMRKYILSVLHIMIMLVT